MSGLANKKEGGNYECLLCIVGRCIYPLVMVVFHALVHEVIVQHVALLSACRESGVI